MVICLKYGYGTLKVPTVHHQFTVEPLGHVPVTKKTTVGGKLTSPPIPSVHQHDLITTFSFENNPIKIKLKNKISQVCEIHDILK